MHNNYIEKLLKEIIKIEEKTMKKYDAFYNKKFSGWDSDDIIELKVDYLNNCQGIKAFAHFSYNCEYFHVCLMTIEKNYISAEKGRLGSPSLDSCLEFFFSPCNDGRYINIEFNSNGCAYIGIGSGIHDLIRLIPEESIEQLFSYVIKTNMFGWEISYKISFEFIRRLFPDFNIDKTSEMRANFYKCCENKNNTHFISWNRVNSKNFTFHSPADFGLIKFKK